MMKFGMAGWGFILGAAGLITLVVTLAQCAKTRSFASCSARVTGHVAGKSAHHANNTRHYSLDVEYTVDGIAYQRPVPALLSEYRTLEIGAPLELNYKPGKPKKIIRADHLSGKNVKALGTVAVGAAVMTAAGIALLFAGRL